MIWSCKYNAVGNSLSQTIKNTSVEWYLYIGVVRSFAAGGAIFFTSKANDFLVIVHDIQATLQATSRTLRHPIKIC